MKQNEAAKSWTGVAPVGLPSRSAGIVTGGTPVQLHPLRIISLVVLLTTFAAGLSEAATRVALVSTCEGDGVREVLALAQAKLSAEPGVELVERTEVERVLREQKLWRCGLSSYGQAVAAGKLLGVEVFAALEVLPNEKEALGLVCFAADSGARLMDVVMPTGAAPTVVNEILTTIQKACAKKQQPGIDRNTVCILAVRNAGLARGLDGVCESVGRMLERRLLSSASLAVMERARLDQVNRERTLPTDLSATNSLTASMVLLELEFTRGTGSNDIHVLVSQSNAAGQSLGKIQADARVDRTVDLVESLSAQLVQSMKVSPPGQPLDLNAEAARFYREANFFYENGLITQAVQAAEAAFALAPANKQSRLILALSLLAKANSMFGMNSGRWNPNKLRADDLKEALALGQRGCGLWVELAAELSPQQMHLAALHWTFDETELDSFLDRARNTVEGYDAESHRQYAEIQTSYRHLAGELYWPAICAVIQTESDLGDGSGICFYRHLCDIEVGASTSSIWTSDTLGTLNLWLSLVNKHTMARVALDRISWILSPMLYRIREPSKMINDIYGHLWSLDDYDLKRLATFFETLKQHPDPLLRLYGLAGDLATTLRREPASSATIRAQLEPIISLGQATIANPPYQSDKYRVAAYQMLLDTFDLLTDRGLRQKECMELFDFMLSRHEYVHWVAMVAVDPQVELFAAYQEGDFSIFYLWSSSSPPTNTALYAQNLERLLVLLNAPDVRRLLDPPRSRKGPLDQQLAKLRQVLAAQQPAAGLNTPAPWTATKLLWNGASRLVHPRVFGDAVWSLNSDQAQPPHWRLARIPLDGGGAQFYDYIPPSGPPDKFYAVVMGNGIAVFPPSGISASYLTETNGLPSGHVSATVCCDGKLYAGLGQDVSIQKTPSFLIKSDLSTGHVKLLASSLCKEKQNGLDGVSPPFFVRQMLADSVRHRVLFTVDIGILKSKAEFTGLWSIDTQTDQLKHLLPFTGACEWISQIRDNEILISRCCYARNCAASVITFNLETDSGRILYTSERLPGEQHMLGTTPPQMLPIGTRPPYMMLNGWFWTADPFCRSLTNGAPREFLPSFTGRPLPLGWGDGWQCLEPVNNGRQILAGVGNQLWLLTLPEKTPKDLP